MRTLFTGMLLVSIAGTVVAQENTTFNRPTDEQIAAAAQSPDQLAALLEGATPEQAAEVVVRVLVAIDALPIDPEAKSTRMSTAVQTATAAIPVENQSRFASALGTRIGNDPVLALSPAAASAAQAGLAAAGAASGVNLGQSFGLAFVAAQQSTVGGGQQETPIIEDQRHIDDDPTPTPRVTAPPLAPPYGGQQI